MKPVQNFVDVDKHIFMLFRFFQPNAGAAFDSLANQQPHLIQAVNPGRPARPLNKAMQSPHYESADFHDQSSPQKTLNWAHGSNKIQQ